MEVVKGLGRGCYDMKLKIGVEYQSGNNFHHPLPKELCKFPDWDGSDY